MKRTIVQFIWLANTYEPLEGSNKSLWPGGSLRPPSGSLKQLRSFLKT